MKIGERLEGKKVLIWGCGREGASTRRFIEEHCRVLSLDVFEGIEAELDPAPYDIIIKSPGIPVENNLDKYTSQTELFLSEFASQTVGITGTKGKSTTSAMLYKALRECLGDRVKLVGNIGLPCLDLYDEYDGESVIVFEMSCHQLSNLRLSPHVAVFLNLFEDHLDRYITRERYFEAKKPITAHQGPGDFLFIRDDVPQIETQAQKIVIPRDGHVDYELKLPGEHNRLNALFVEKVCTQIYGCDRDKVQRAVSDFEGLPHRMRLVAQIAGVDYYDDSISTIPEATIEALRSIKNAKTVLIGGMDRNINYGVLIDFIKTHGEFEYIFSYRSGKRIYDEVREQPNCRYVEDLKSAVELAKRITPAGMACVLSPAAASYGYFKNFEERGDAFLKYVLG